MGITNRTVYVKGATPSIGAAGSSFTDPVFGSRMVRVTDAAFTTDLGTGTDSSFRSPASSYQQAWNADNTKFTVIRTDGNVFIVTVNPTTLATARLGNVAPSFASGTCTFDSADARYLYGIGLAANHHTLVRTDVSVVPITTSTFLDLDTITAGLSDTYVGALVEGNGKLMCTYGGASQEEHHFVLHYPIASPGSLQVLDTRTRLGMDEFNTLFYIHSAQIDKSGRYVSLASTTATIGGVVPAPYRIYIWDTTLNTVVPVPTNAQSGGHEVLGWETRINNAVLTSFDAAQWVYTPSLLAPTSNRAEVISPLVTPQEVFAADHSSWNNAVAGTVKPFCSGFYRYYSGPFDVDPVNNVAWRPWDDEILMIDPLTGAVTRYCHGRSQYWREESLPGSDVFWYTMRPNISNDGTKAIFTSNWDKTLGIEAGTGIARQDTFLVELLADAVFDARVRSSRRGSRLGEFAR